MWIYPVIISVVLVICLWAVQRHDGHRFVRAHHRYHRKYRGLLEDLDRIRMGLIAILGRISSEVGNQDAFAEYEKLVTDFERLLVSMRLLPMASPNLHLLKSAEMLADSLQVRLAAVDRALGLLRPKKSVNSRSEKRLAGCYFCSKPALSEPLKRIRIKIDAEMKQVLGCAVCREAVKLNRTAKVLFFVKDGKSVHWSESPDYRPDAGYFEINSPNSKELGRSQLRLVYSTIDEQTEMRD